MKVSSRRKIWWGAACAGVLLTTITLRSAVPTANTLSATFERLVLTAVGPESPLELRLFAAPVKTDSRGRVITGISGDPVKNIVGAEPAGMRAGLQRFTKIMFAADYFSGQPDLGQRMNPNAPAANGGSRHWPFVKQPFRSWPTALAVTPSGNKVYVALPGREGYPDSGVAVVDTANRRVLRWIDVRTAGNTRRTRPVGLAASPVNTALYPRSYLVVLNQYGNFATVIDTASDAVTGEFETGFYAEDLVFNKDGTRLYITDRFKDQVRVFNASAALSSPRSHRLLLELRIWIERIPATWRSAPTILISMSRTHGDTRSP